MSTTPNTVPMTVKVAAGILLLYGIGVLVGALQARHLVNYEPHPVRTAIRCGAMALAAWGLIRQTHWAWWLAILLPSFWIITGILGLDVVGPMRSSINPRSGSFFLYVDSSLIVLAVAIALLLLPGSRAAFRRPAAA